MSIYKKRKKHMSKEGNLAKLEHIAHTMNGAVEALVRSEIVAYRIEDTNKAAGYHGATAVHYPKENRAVIQLPNDPTHLIMALHAAEALLYGVKHASIRNSEILIPELELVLHDEFEPPANGHYSAKAVLDVEVEPTLIVEAHKNFSTSKQDLSVESVVRQHYEQLVKMLEVETILLTGFPVNTLFMMPVRGVDVKQKHEVTVAFMTQRNGENPHITPVPGVKMSNMVIRKSHETL
jgi:hypothetical protein